MALKFCSSDNISDHYLISCVIHIAKAVNSTTCYKYGRTITSTTKDCFVHNLPDLSQFLSISNSSEQLDDVTETTDSLFSRTLYRVAPLHLRKIKENSPTLNKLPFLSKILEKVVSSQLYFFLEKNGIYEVFQSGLRLYHSNETVLIRVTNYLLLSSNPGCRDVHRPLRGRGSSGKKGTSHIYFTFFLNKMLNILGVCDIDKNIYLNIIWDFLDNDN